MLNVQHFFKRLISVHIVIFLVISMSKVSSSFVWADNPDPKVQNQEDLNPKASSDSSENYNPAQNQEDLSPNVNPDSSEDDNSDQNKEDSSSKDAPNSSVNSNPDQNQEDLSPIANPDSAEDIGPVLHAWCWKFNDVSRYINEISEAGYKGIQVSPVQPEKETDDVQDNGRKEFRTWWSFYQPLGFKIGNYLGTDKEFEHMCEQAHKVGIRIIVDIVSNHLAEKTGIDNYLEAISPELRAIYNSKELFYDTASVKYSKDNPPTNRQQFTKCNSAGGLALNTKNKVLQAIIRKFLKSLIDLGADGFRFDAAKHIELPEDSEDLNSDFWPSIIRGLNDYYKQKGHKNNLFIYGEVLSDNINVGYKNENENGTCVEKAYLKYLNITDDQMGASIRSILYWNKKRSYDLGPVDIVCYCRNKTNVDPGHFVTWVESHDNYGTTDSPSTRDLTAEDIRLGWAIIASRRSSVPLYLARPLKKHEGVDDLIGSIGGPGDFYWADRSVREVNRFRAAMVGRKEYIIKLNESVYVILREGCGATVVNLSYEEQEINVNTLYKDFSGLLNEKSYRNSLFEWKEHGDERFEFFRVENNFLKGFIKARSVATLYLDGTYPFLNFTIGTPYAGSLTVYFQNPGNCAINYSFDGVNFNKLASDVQGIKLEIGKDKKIGSEIQLTIRGHAENEGFVIVSEKKYIYTKITEPKAVIKIKDTNNAINSCKLYMYAVDYSQKLKEDKKWDERVEIPKNKVSGYFENNISSNKNIIVWYEFFNNKFQFPATLHPGIPVHLGEEIVIDGDTIVSVSDLGTEPATKG